jgi:hypothetical protein
MSDTAVLGDESSGIFVQFFASGKARQDVIDGVPICMKVGNIPTKIFIRTVAQHFHLCPICL